MTTSATAVAGNGSNIVIGLADDDPVRLRRIAANLRRALRQVATRPQPGLFDVADLAAEAVPGE
jgi:hypothetical protein